MRDYSIILFDLDGTISDSSAGIISCIKYALEQFNIEEENADVLRSFVGPPLKDHFIEVYGFTNEQADVAVARYREKYDPKGAYENELYPGIKELLLSLKKAGKVVCVATSKPEDTATLVLKHFGIYDYFDFVVGAERNGPRKNKDQVIAELFRRADITDDKKSMLVMVGDTKYDILGANKMGVDSIGVNYGFGDKNEMLALGAKIVVDTVDELKSLLLQ